MRLLGLSWLIYSLCVYMVLLHLLVIGGLCIFSTYVVSFGALEFGYKTTRVG